MTSTSLRRFLLTGAFGFGLVSLIVFASVAFAERWMYVHLGVSGAYLTWTLLFILFGGGVLGSLVSGRWRLPKFYLLFGIAFFAYAVGWVAAYFFWPGIWGELLGSVIGSLLMAAVFAVGFGVVRSILTFFGALFVANSVGYFVGSTLNDILSGKLGMLSWGVVYGLCLGAGLGLVLYLAQKEQALRV